MTDLMETIARAICLDQGDDPDSTEGGLIMHGREGIRPNWEGYESAASATVAAIEAAGFAVVPKDATLEMFNGFASVNCKREPDRPYRITFEGDSGNWLACWHEALAAAPKVTS